MSVLEIARSARLASVSLQSVTNEQKNQALLRIKQVLSERRQEIFEANERDKQVCKYFIFILYITQHIKIDCQRTRRSRKAFKLIIQTLGYLSRRQV